MAPAQTRKRASETMELDAQAITPTGSPARKKMKITQTQKQAMIDNLQLEVTERARHLRAHYALQCSDLRARIERRINRIPLNLRKVNMGELFEKHAIATQDKLPSKDLMYAATKSSKNNSRPTTATEERPLPALPQIQSATKLPSPIRLVEAQTASMPRGRKQKSSEIIIATDKENENTENDNLSVVKNPKRTKIGPAGRNISRTNKSTSVLSPKSHNSRTLPHSPIKDVKAMPSSPSKPSYIARPLSPLKPASPLKSAASAATSAISASIHGMMGHAKRGTATTTGKLSRTTSQEKSAAAGKMLPPPRPTAASGPSASERGRAVSASSNTSAASSSSTTSTTTVVKTRRLGGSKTMIKEKAITAKATPKTALRKNAAVSAAGKRVVVAEPAAGKRVLRKRN